MKNIHFWNSKFCQKKSISTDKSNATVLYTDYLTETALAYGIVKTALCIARAKGATPLSINAFGRKRTKTSLVGALNSNMVGNKFEFFLVLVINIIPILIRTISIFSGQRLVDLKIKQCSIGVHIYDAILRREKIPTITKLTFNIRFRVAIELIYFYYFRFLFRKYNVCAVVLADTVYRDGLLFELARVNEIECYGPINLNSYSIAKFDTPERYKTHYRKPEAQVLNKIEVSLARKHMADYFDARFQGKIEQHDVINAYGIDKSLLSRDEVLNEYKLDNELPIVVVMCHIFCDAPHGYPDLLFKDYYDWLRRTVCSLKKNSKVNFLVKEHPSAHLYGESGLVADILTDLGCGQRLLKSNVCTTTVLEVCDTVVTCGGTIGLEFAYKGKASVLGAKPPYSGFGFTKEFKCVSNYLEYLESGIEQIGILSKTQQEMAWKVIFHDFVLLNNYCDSLELGGQRAYMGKQFNYEKFNERVSSYNTTPLLDQKVYRMLESFVHSNSKHLMSGEYYE